MTGGHEPAPGVGSPGGAAGARRVPGPFLACLLYALRVCVPPKRWAVLSVPVVAAGLFGLLARAVAEPTAALGFATASEGIWALVLPFACLVVGDAVLGAEVRSGTFALTWLSPTPFATIVAARWLAGWAVSAVVLVPAAGLAAMVAGAPDAAGAAVVAVVGGAGAYVAVFVLVGAATRRAALWSLGVVLLGERLLGGVLSGIAQLSPQWLARNVYAELGPEAEDLWRSGVPSGAGALVRLALVAAVCLALATRRVARLRVAGGDE